MNLLHPHVTGAVRPHGVGLPRHEEGGGKVEVTPWPEVTAGPNVTSVSRGDSLGWSRLPRPQRTSSILCVLWRPRCSVGAAGTGDGRRSRARRAGGGCRAVRGAGAPLPRPLCAICGSDAGLARRGRGCVFLCLRAASQFSTLSLHDALPI